MRKSSIFWGAVIGGIYIVVPTVISLINVASGNTGGDPGPYGIFSFLPYWPAWFTLGFSNIIFWLIFALIQPSNEGSFIFVLLSGILNITLWIFIGILIGWVIKKIKSK